MRPHVHDESESASGGDHLHRWDASRMRKHLRNVHDIQAPMSWDIGRLHQAHLTDHQTRTTIQTQSTAEEAPMTETQPQTPQTKAHDHDGVGGIDGFHQRVKEVHGPVATTFLRAHLALMHGRTGLDDVTDHDALEDMHAVLHEEAAPLVRQIPVQADRTRDPEERHAEHRVQIDRFIAAMAGLDFDREWAADDGIGPNARGALRLTFQRAAEQLFYVLNRGGLRPFGPLSDVEQTALDDLLGKVATAQADRTEALNRADELQRQWREAQSAMQEMAQAREESESLVSDLEEVNNQLREQLATTGRQLTETVGERDLLRGDKARLKADLEQMATGNQRNIASIDALEEELAEARDERDRAQQALMAKLTEAGALREERDDLARRNEALEAELQAVSTVTEASQASAEPTDQPPVEAEQFQDDLLWARRFAEGGEA